LDIVAFWAQPISSHHLGGEHNSQGYWGTVCQQACSQQWSKGKVFFFSGGRYSYVILGYDFHDTFNCDPIIYFCSLKFCNSNLYSFWYLHISVIILSVILLFKLLMHVTDQVLQLLCMFFGVCSVFLFIIRSFILPLLFWIPCWGTLLGSWDKTRWNSSSLFYHYIQSM